jgi:hypothetical protein
MPVVSKLVSHSQLTLVYVTALVSFAMMLSDVTSFLKLKPIFVGCRQVMRWLIMHRVLLLMLCSMFILVSFLVTVTLSMMREFLSALVAATYLDTYGLVKPMIPMLHSDQLLALQVMCVDITPKRWFQSALLMLNGQSPVDLFPSNYNGCERSEGPVATYTTADPIWNTDMIMVLWPHNDSTLISPKCCTYALLTGSSWTLAGLLQHIFTVILLTILIRHLLIVMLKVYIPGLEITNALRSLALECLIRLTGRRYGTMGDTRRQFVNLPMVISKPQSNHSHANAARFRNDANNTMRLFATSLGKSIYMLQMSASDQKRGTRGLRTFHWARDSAIPMQADLLSNKHIVGLVDTDHYYDMPTLLADYPVEYLISTFQPSETTSTTDDYSFRFTDDGAVLYAVSGGAVYNHRVWNYAGDIIFVKSSRFIGNRWTTYSVSRKSFDPHHVLIYLQPVVTFWSPIKFELSGRGLNYLDMRVKEFNRLDIQTTDGLLRSTAKIGSWASATIPVEVDDTIATTARLNSTGITVAQIRSITKSDDATQAAVLAEYHRANNIAAPPIVFPPSEAVMGFQFMNKEYDHDAVVPMKAFMSPIVHGAYVPVRSKANDIEAVRGRILDVKAEEGTAISPFYASCIAEFLKLLIPDKIAKTHHPVDLPTVYVKQARPSQRALLGKVENLNDLTSTANVTTFQKTEAYQKPTDPRIISTIPTSNKLHYSAFTYAFSEYLKTMPWYAFGKVPKEIAETVARICSESKKHLSKTDLRRMDGHINDIGRVFEKSAMLRFFCESYDKDLEDLMATQHHQKAVTAFGVKYATLFARLSGSPETADFNSLENCLGSYCALRKTVNLNTGQHYTPEEAWAKLGLFGGDDGIQGDVDPEAQVKAYAMLGQELEIEIVPHGALGVDMLARKYGPDVWWGSSNSMCDISRQLAKLHTSPNLPSNITPSQKLATKLFSYYLTDRNTPIIGDLATLVVTRYPDLIVKPEHDLEVARQLMNYFSMHPAVNQFVNIREDWMYDVIRADMPDFDEGLFACWLRECRTEVGKLLTPPLCQPLKEHPPVTKPVDVSGEVLLPKKGPADRTCRHFKAGNCTWADKCKFSHSA